METAMMLTQEQQERVINTARAEMLPWQNLLMQMELYKYPVAIIDGSVIYDVDENENYLLVKKRIEEIAVNAQSKLNQ